MFWDECVRFFFTNSDETLENGDFSQIKQKRNHDSQDFFAIGLVTTRKKCYNNKEVCLDLFQSDRKEFPFGNLPDWKKRIMEQTQNLGRKRAMSVISLLYFLLIVALAVLSFFYTVEVPQKAACCVVLIAISGGALAAMLYSRKQVLTKICSVLLLPFLLPSVLLCFGEWEVLVPLVVTALLAFFLCGCTETIKTVFGTIFLLLYVLGSLAYFLGSSLFSTSMTTAVVDSGISPSRKYRYEVINTEDSSNGSTAVTVEPNNYDVNLGVLEFRAEGYERTVSLERPMQEETVVRWETQTRQQITEELLTISEDVTLQLPASDRKALGYDENATIYLRNLTDQDLERLGVPQNNDVMYVNDQVCFRSYIAILEDYFSPSKHAISAF